jgi:hypothetical protein
MKFVSHFVRSPFVGRSALAALFTVVAALGAGCPGADGEPDAGPGVDQVCTDIGTEVVCDNDRVCVGGFCDKLNDGDDTNVDDDLLGCCVRVLCLSNEDCDDNEKCDVRRGLCVPKNLCDPAGENGGLCTQDDGSQADCCGAGQLCEYTNGLPQCVDSPPAAENCFIAAGGRPVAVDAGDTEGFPAVTAAGQDLQLEGVGLDGDGNVVAHTTFTWQGANASGVVTDPACAAGVCDLEVTATTVNGNASCTGLVRVYAAPTDNRIVVLDLATGEPLSGVDVAAATGGVVEPGTTDADGAAEFAGAIDSISAFPATHQWHTIVGPPGDVIIYTARLPNENRIAGIKGTFNFDSVHTQGDIKLGLSGTAIASSITDLNFATLIGDIADYNVELEGITDPGGQLVPLPSGLVINLGDNPIKGDYVTFGEPGPNIGWAIGGQVPLAEVGPIISGVATGGDDINIGSILGGVLPFFARFDHAIVPGLNLVETDRPADPGDDTPIPFDQWDFDEKVITPNTLLALSAPYTMPASLPCAPGAGTAPACAGDAFATGAVLLSGVIVPGIGLVPLGLTAGLDDFEGDGSQVDGQIDNDPDTGVAKGDAVIDYAPPHDGLEGNTFVSVAIALDLNAIGGDSSAFGASIITHITKKFDPNNNEFPQNFLESQGGTFAPGAAGSFTLAPTGNADFWRVNFSDGGETEWNVWFADEAAVINVADHHPVPADAAARVVDADIQAFVLGTGYEAIGPAPATYDDLFAFDGKDIDNLLYYLGAWSSEACKVDGHCAAP